MIAFTTQGGRDLHRPPCPPIWHVPRTPSSFMNYAYYALKSLYLSVVLQAGQGLSKQQVNSNLKLLIDEAMIIFTNLSEPIRTCLNLFQHI